MKKLLICLLILTTITVSVSAENTSVKFGMLLGFGFVDSPKVSDIINEIDKGVNFKPGFEFGMKVNRMGFGLSSFLVFNRTESADPDLNWD